MFELPSDPPRLRMILDFLDEQVARNQTIGIYVSVQQKAVRHALSVAEGQAEAARRLVCRFLRAEGRAISVIFVQPCMCGPQVLGTPYR
ncbi:hypothetical protein OHB41_38520 [Streptomyces sp. NBC_01571]|uniref:hypothetical protein n=1 Tax=Streptomyces sp. NBC_01571 TaxID=2975883 RepID=UPI00225B7E28|nr:hypothetical protein [Streptomyces sp. NBC_01571]MCX4578982.1 hypothetical protein [Streptomyces sp. NBC_01571]